MMAELCEECVLLKWKPVISAVSKGHLNCLKSIIARGAEVNETGYSRCTSLMLAARYGYHECMEFLLEAGADVNIRNRAGETALVNAVSFSHFKCVDLLLKAEANVNVKSTKGCTLLHCVYKSPIDKCEKDSGHFGPKCPPENHSQDKSIELLIKAGADVSETNGFDVLMFVSGKGYCRSLKSLLEIETDVNQTNINGGTALITAASIGRKQCVNLLIKAEADVNKANNQGRAPLVFAACNGYDECVESLIKSGANVNAITNRGNTPLNKAAYSGNMDSILYLLRANSKINMINYIGKNALKIHLTECNVANDDIMMLLYAAGEILNTKSVTSQESDPDEGLCLKNMCKEAIRNHLNLVKKDHWGANVQQIAVPKCLQFTELKLCLKHLCRESIRKHLINLNPHELLFRRVPQLGLPSLVNDYLLFGISIEENDEVKKVDGKDYVAEHDQSDEECQGLS